MVRRGKRSRIDDENRQAQERNRKQATRQRAAKNLAAAIAREEARVSTRERPAASNENRSAFLNAAQDAHRDAITQLSDRHAVRLAKTEEENRELYGKRTASLKRELEEIKTRFDEGGMFYHLTRAKADRQRARELQLSIQDGETRAQERLDAIQHEYDAEKLQIDRRYENAQREDASRKLQRDFPTLEQQQDYGRDAGHDAGRGIDRAGVHGSGRGMDRGPQLER